MPASVSSAMPDGTVRLRVPHAAPARWIRGTEAGTVQVTEEDVRSGARLERPPRA